MKAPAKLAFFRECDILETNREGGYGMDIAAASMALSAAQVSTQASVLVLKNSLDFMEEISNEMMEALLSLPVGPAAHSALDLYV